LLQEGLSVLIILLLSHLAIIWHKVETDGYLTIFFTTKLCLWSFWTPSSLQLHRYVYALYCN